MKAVLLASALLAVAGRAGSAEAQTLASLTWPSQPETGQPETGQPETGQPERGAADLQPAPPFHLAADPQSRERALTCLAAAVYYEAADQPLQGQEAVAQVVLNRVRPIA